MRGLKCHTGKNSVENVKNLGIVVLERTYLTYGMKIWKIVAKNMATKDFLRLLFQRKINQSKN